MSADNNDYVALALAGPLIANTTSVFNALAALLVVTPLLLLLTGIPLRHRSSMQRIAISAVVGAVAGSLLLLGIHYFAPLPQANDIVDAYSFTVLLAMLAAVGTKATEPSPLPLHRLAALLLITGALCEILGYGVLLGDHEIAFAGATLAWRIRLMDGALLPLAASPAGALLVAALVYGVTRSRAVRTQQTKVATTSITEPRTGRRVRVTGHIS